MAAGTARAPHAGAASPGQERSSSPRARQWRRMLRHRSGMAGAVILLVFLVAALTAPWISPHDPIEMDLGEPLTPPGPAFFLGLDSLGRDVLSRVLHGASISLRVAGTATAVSLVGGTATGLVAAYYGGALDGALMRCMDALLSFPAILLALALSAAFGMNLNSAILALGIVYMPRFARLVRGSALTAMGMEFVQAARALGARDLRILTRHLLPSVTAPIFVQASFTFGQSIISEAALSFLGVGTQPPNPSWGLMLDDARRYLSDAAWYPLVPGAAIAAVVLGANLLGDGLRDVMDPTLKID